MPRHISAFCLLLGLIIVPAFPVNLYAQTQGEITGVITDPGGAVVPGVTVTVTNAATNAARKAASNESGVYSFPALQPGAYSIKVERPGFKAITQNDVQLQVQQTARIDFTLEVGNVTEIVEVQGGSGALMTTENATVGTVIENKRIVDLPLN
nr:carboxypeptidase regulatory-like domain-containing protein [Pyrinomonadaceae bacterium]